MRNPLTFHPFVITARRDAPFVTDKQRLPCSSHNESFWRWNASSKIRRHHVLKVKPTTDAYRKQVRVNKRSALISSAYTIIAPIKNVRCLETSVNSFAWEIHENVQKWPFRPARCNLASLWFGWGGGTYLPPTRNLSHFLNFLQVQEKSSVYYFLCVLPLSDINMWQQSWKYSESLCEICSQMKIKTSMECEEELRSITSFV